MTSTHATARYVDISVQPLGAVAAEPSEHRLQVDPGSLAAHGANTVAASRSLPATYVTAWAVLGALSAGYLGFSAWDNTGDATLGRKVTALASDVTELRSAVGDIVQQQTVTTGRMAALETTIETRIAGLATTAARATSTSEPKDVQAVANRPTEVRSTITVPGVALVTTRPAPPQVQTAPQPRAEAPADAIPAVIAAAPTEPRKPTKLIATAPLADGPAMIAKTASAQVEPAVRAKAAKAADAYVPPRGKATAASAIATGSLPSTAPSGLGVQSAPSGPIGIEVAASPSLDGARQSWGSIRSRDGGALTGVEPRVMPNADGSAFRVIAGPYNSEADAQKACVALKARGLGCQPAGFGGAPL